MPVYNMEDFLHDSLDSIVNQTLHEIEIIIINDGSKDNSLKIAQSYKKFDERIKIINQENQGLSGARNTGLEKANGKYVYFFDADDKLQNDCLERCFNLAEKNNLDVVTFDADVFYEKGIKTMFNPNYDRQGQIPNKEFDGESFFNYLIKENLFKASVCLNFIKEDILDRNELKFYPALLHEDELFTPQLYLLANKIQYIDEKFFKRRIRNDSIMTKGISDKKIKSRFIIINELYDLYKNKYKNKSLKIRIKSQARSILGKLIETKKKSEYKNELKSILKNKKDILDWKFMIMYYLSPLYLKYRKIKKIDVSN